MTDRLFDLPADISTLPDRQRRGYQAIAGAGWDGLTSMELGSLIHEHKRGETCSFCSSAANEVGGALRSKGLVCQRRRKDVNGLVYSVWTTVDARRPVSEGEIPF